MKATALASVQVPSCAAHGLVWRHVLCLSGNCPGVRLGVVHVCRELLSVSGLRPVAAITSVLGFVSTGGILAGCAGQTPSSTPTVSPVKTSRGSAVAHVDAVHFMTPRTGWVTTTNARHLLMTTDGGASWVDITPPSVNARMRLASGLAGAFFLSAKDFWVGVCSISDRSGLAPGFVMHTDDGGRSWTQSQPLARCDDHLWVYFLSPSRGWLMVGNGQAANQEPVAIYRTTTGGRSWSEITHSAIPTIESGAPGAPSSYCDKTGLSFASASSGWTTGYCNGPIDLQHSGDGGRTWTGHVLNPTHSNTTWGGQADPPRFFTPTTGVLQARVDTAKAAHDAIYTTTDGGAGWTAHRPPASTNGPMDVLSATTWYIASHHKLYRTTNGGNTWTTIRSSIPLNGDSADILDFINTTNGWAVRSNGTLWHTNDAGRSWTRATPTT